MIDFRIKTFGNFCNSAPFLHVSAGSHTLWTGNISGHVEIHCRIPTCQPITVSGIGKLDGEHGVYDTYVDEEGSIINDKYLRILDISIHGVSMENQWLNNLDLVCETGSGKFAPNAFWSNGRLVFEVDEPVLDWIIDQKYLQFVQDFDIVLDAKSGHDRFYYGPMIKQIQKIRSMLNDSHPDL